MATRNKLLQYLKKEKENWVSGEALSNRLNVSRAAVNKHIQKLRQEGYRIESSTKKGYRIESFQDLLFADEIQKKLNTKIFGKPSVIVLKETDSTNLQAKKMAAEGAEEGTLVVAESQFSGRGRKGREWFSPPGLGIYSSLILRPDIPPSEAPGITLTTAVAAAEAIIELTGISAKIKWPNDILIKGKKIAGILTEISTEMDAVDYIVVGFGMNVNTPPADFPSGINLTATSLFAETNITFSRITILRAYLQKFETYYGLFKKTGFAGIREKWKTHSDMIGKKVIVKKIGDDVSGQITDIDHDGVLILKDEIGKVHRIFSGDLILQATENTD